jgi:hypothetical protein
VACGHDLDNRSGLPPISKTNSKGRGETGLTGLRENSAKDVMRPNKFRQCKNPPPQVRCRNKLVSESGETGVFSPFLAKKRTR